MGTYSSLVFCAKVCIYCTPRARQVGEVEERKRVNARSSRKLSEFGHVPVRAAIFGPWPGPERGALPVSRAFTVIKQSPSDLNIGLHNAFCLLLTRVLGQ